jgi:sterol desaturase/sphingolipid hydroxylase (fatty acid hydroxylase superfamily)
MKILSSPIFLILALFMVLVLTIAIIFTQAFDHSFTFISDKILSITHYMWQQFISIDKLKYILILSACFLIDLIFIGYNKSAMANILKPNKSTKSDIYIFIIGLMGLRHYFVMFSFLLVGYFSAGWIDSKLAFNWLHSIDSAILQLIIYMLAYDFLDYWIHRCAHRVSWWWEVHRFHHSATNFNIITVARSHPLDLAFADFIVIIPMALMGVPIEQLLIIAVFRSMLGKLQHSMIDWNFGILGKYIFMSPVAHRIHHSPYPEHWDKHYGHTFIFWDRMFGTYYDGDFINDKVGLSNTTDNEHGLVYDIVMGQINFLNAFFLKKWSFKEGVMSSSEIEAYQDDRPKLHVPVNNN